MKKMTSGVMCILFTIAALSVSSCGGGADIDPALLGYWIESDSDGGLYIDGDGYGWGVEIARNGNLTVARLDWDAGVINTEATGPFAKVLTARGGVLEVEEEGEVVQGSYTLSSVTSTTGDTHPFLTVDLGGTDYYVKVAELQ
ncbi:MAG: hypothetical protein JXR96_17765 [Deltaproteobacteria bacterium]|nr:hypothetical protein [Deltaproteobacteria bacterium]